MFKPFDTNTHDFDIYSSTSKAKTFYVCEVQGNNIKYKKCNSPNEFIDSFNKKLVIPPLYKYLINSKISIDTVEFILDDTISEISCFFVVEDLTTDPPELFPSMESTYFIDPTEQRQIASSYIKNHTTISKIQPFFDNAYGMGTLSSGLSSISAPSSTLRQGIINPGANCYINALIQLLNDIPDFKNQIKAIDTETAISNEVKPVLTRYYDLKMYQDMFNYSEKSDALENIWNSSESMEKKLADIDKLLLDTQSTKLNEIEQDILSSLYPCGNECNRDLKSQFRAEIVERENEIKHFIQNLDLAGKKMLLTYLLQKFFNTIEGDNKISFEPLLLPLLLFGDFEQHDTLEAFGKINDILDESTLFYSIKTTFTSNKYFIKDIDEFNSFNKSPPQNRLLSTKIDNNNLVVNVNVNLDKGFITNIGHLLNAQNQPRIVPDSLLRNTLITNPQILQEYNEDYSSKTNINSPVFNAFTQDIISDTNDYIVVCLIRESGDGLTINNAQVNIVEIEIERKTYEPIGVLVRTGDVGAGHFYYVDIKGEIVYNDGHVYKVTDNTEMLTNWRVALYKKKIIMPSSGGRKRKTFRVSRRKKTKPL